MNYALLMLVVFIIWMFFYFIADEKIERRIIKPDVTTLLILGALFILFWFDIRFRQQGVITIIWACILYATLLINIVIKILIFLRNKKIYSKVNDLSHQEID